MDAESTLQIVDYKLSDGAPVKAGQTVTVHYAVALSLDALEGSQWIDSSYERGSIRFVLGAGQVLKGVDQGLEGMRVGSTRRLIIPPKLGFGERGVPGKVPPDSVLFFEIYLAGMDSTP